MTPDALKSNITRAAGIALGWVAGRYHLDPSQVGAMMSDVGYVGTGAAFLYGAYQHWGMKKVPEASVAIAPATPGDAAAPVGTMAAGKVVG